MAGIFDSIIKPAASIIEKVIPDADKARELAHEIATMAAKDEQAVRLAQIAVNKAEAESASVFKGGWRPFIGWVCGVALAYNYIAHPFLIFGGTMAGVDLTGLPELDLVALMPLVFGMLGLVGSRSYDKKNGVSSK